MTSERDGLPPDEILSRYADEEDRGGKKGKEHFRTSIGTHVEGAIDHFNRMTTEELASNEEILSAFRETVFDAIAFYEGLPGTSGYNFDRPALDAEARRKLSGEERKQIEQQIRRSRLQTMLFERLFLSREGSRERPYSYVSAKIEEATFERRWRIDQERKIRAREKDRGPISREQQKAEENLETELFALYLHHEARTLIDEAFKQRQFYAEDSGSTKEALSRGKTIDWRIPIYPDRVDWAAAFTEIVASKFGDKVDKTLRKIVDIGERGLKKNGETLIEHPYAEGIVKTEHFTEFIKQIYEAADQDMGAAWLSWRLALLWEIPSKYGVAIKKKPLTLPDGREIEGYIPVVGDAPLTADWYSSTAFLDFERFIEGGWYIDPKDEAGKKKLEASLQDPAKLRELLTAHRHLVEMFYNKIGLPLNLGRIGSIAPATYLESAKGKFAKKDGNGNIIRNQNGEPVLEDKPTSFWQKWREGVPLKDLPWWETEQVATGTEEATPTGSFQFWAFVNRIRALSIADLVTNMPGPQDLVDFKTWKSLARNWSKLKLDQDARKWLILSWIYPYVGLINNYGTKEAERDLGARVLNMGEQMGDYPLTNAKPGMPTIDSALANAFRAKFITKEDIDWIKKTISKKPTEIVSLRD
ncbi:MAG: hypothetical protein ABIB61_04475 [Candidatus Shapirobacteria bacterium]